MAAMMYQLRKIYTLNKTEQGAASPAGYTSFVAMTDVEFEEFRGSNAKTLDAFKDRIIHTVAGSASEQDIQDAVDAYTHRYSKGPQPGQTLAAS